MGEEDYLLEASVVRAGKRGHKCCGGCCDMRRAVIIVDIIKIFLAVFGMAALLTIFTVLDPSNFDDDEVKTSLQNLEDIEEGHPNLKWLAIVVPIIRLALYVTALVGAIQFKTVFVGLGIVAYIFDLILSILAMSLGGIAISIGFAYPHVMLIKEIQAGIMTEQNYPYER